MSTDKKLKLLIVDDERDLRLTIKEIFEIFGWEVQDAENGARGLELMRQQKFDFVISDIRMPISSGIELLKSLSPETKNETPIIMMTAYSDYSDEAVRRLGAHKLIPKPISINDLVREMKIFKLPKAG